MLNFNALYLFENEIMYKESKSDKIFSLDLPNNTLKYGRINDIKTFEKYFKKILSNINKINLLTKGKLKIVYNDLYTQLDKKIIKEICFELNFKEVTFINENKLFKDYKKKVYINSYNGYSFIYFKENCIIKTVCLIGDLKLPNNLLEKFKNCSIFICANNSFENEFLEFKHYYYQNSREMIINLVFEK